MKEMSVVVSGLDSASDGDIVLSVLLCPISAGLQCSSPSNLITVIFHGNSFLSVRARTAIPLITNTSSQSHSASSAYKLHQCYRTPPAFPYNEGSLHMRLWPKCDIHYKTKSFERTWNDYTPSQSVGRH